MFDEDFFQHLKTGESHISFIDKYIWIGLKNPDNSVVALCLSIFYENIYYINNLLPNESIYYENLLERLIEFCNEKGIHIIYLLNQNLFGKNSDELLLSIGFLKVPNKDYMMYYSNK